MSNQSSVRFKRKEIKLRRLILLLCLLLHGCPPVEEITKTPQKLNEPTWNELISAVRSHESNELRLTDRPLTVEQASELKIACQKLRILQVDHSKLSLEQFEETMAFLPELEQLVLDGPVDNEQLKLISQRLPRLKVLNIPNGTFDDQAIEHLQTLQQLELLRFQSPNVTNAGIKLIPELSHLRSLHLINVPVNDIGLEPLAKMKNLESFYLDGSQCTENGLSKLIKARPDLHFHWNQLHLDADSNAHEH